MMQLTASFMSVHPNNDADPVSSAAGPAAVANDVFPSNVVVWTRPEARGASFSDVFVDGKQKGAIG